MPLALIALAWILVMTGIRGDYTAVGAAFSQDVVGSSGQGGFLSWMIGIVGISVFFRVIGLPGAGKVFMGLVIVVFLLQNNAAVFTNLENVGTSSQPPSSGTQPALPSTGAANTATSPTVIGGSGAIPNGAH